MMQEHGHALPNKVSLRNLHQDRNRVQHGGSTFHFTQARKYIRPVEHTLTSAFSNVFGIDFENFREWDFIENDDLRRWLKESEDALKQGGPTVCIAACNYIHRLIVKAVREYTTEMKYLSSSVDLHMRGLDMNDYASLARTLQKLNKEITEKIDLLDEELVAIGVGLPVMDTRRFRRCGRLVSQVVFMDGHMDINWREGSLEERNTSAHFMLNYLSRLVSLIEEGYPGALGDVKIKMPLSEQGFD